MPATFDSFGIKFLYPDNWVVADRVDGDDGVTLDLPGGGFLSIDVDQSTRDDEDMVQQVRDAINDEYEEVEFEPIDDESQAAGAEFRFYYLDLLIQSRLVLLHEGGRRLVVQMQAESRDFESNEKVFEAILTQIRS